MNYKIGDVVKLLNINKETIRYYEKIGLLKGVAKDDNGYRIYTDFEIEMLEFILMAKKYDFTLKEIGLIIAEFEEDEKMNYKDIVNVVNNKISEINKKIEEMNLMKTVLEKIKDNAVLERDICYCGKTSEEILNL